MIELDRIYNEDCLEGMKRIDSDSIDLVVTSPPYDNLRTYNGYSFDFKNTAKSLYRIIKSGGVLVWVVGDATVNGSETGTSFTQALYFMKCGFRLHDTMIYRKVNPIPQNHNRYEQCFEYMFCLSKGKPKKFNPILVKTRLAGKAINWGERKTEMDAKQCRRHRQEKDIHIVGQYKRHDNIFEYTIGGGKTGHPAVFPEMLARDQILSWSNEGDVILDPFMGSGTTAIACLREKRHFVGFELNQEYYEKAMKRIKAEQAFR